MIFKNIVNFYLFTLILIVCSSSVINLSYCQLDQISHNSDINEQDECTICLDEINADSQELICKHKFHQDCLDNWQNRSNACPNCRQDIERVSNIRCSICLDLIGQSTENNVVEYVRLGCDSRHIFHQDCLKACCESQLEANLELEHPNCPSCQTSILLNQYKRKAIKPQVQEFTSSQERDNQPKNPAKNYNFWSSVLHDFLLVHPFVSFISRRISQNGSRDLNSNISKYRIASLTTPFIARALFNTQENHQKDKRSLLLGVGLSCALTYFVYSCFDEQE